MFNTDAAQQRRGPIDLPLQDGRVAVVVLFDSTVTVWDLEKQEPLTVLQRWGQRDAALGHTGGVNAAYVTRDGSRALTVSKDCTARIWDMASGASMHVLEGPHPPRQPAS